MYISIRLYAGVRGWDKTSGYAAKLDYRGYCDSRYKDNRSRDYYKSGKSSECEFIRTGWESVLYCMWTKKRIDIKRTSSSMLSPLGQEAPPRLERDISGSNLRQRMICKSRWKTHPCNNSPHSEGSLYLASDKLAGLENNKVMRKDKLRSRRKN